MFFPRIDYLLKLTRAEKYIPFFLLAVIFFMIGFSAFQFTPVYAGSGQSIPLVISDFISIGPESGTPELSQASGEFLRNKFIQSHTEINVIKPEGISSLEEAHDQTTFDPNRLIVDIHNKYKKPFIILGFYQLQPGEQDNSLKYFGTVTLYDAHNGRIIEQVHLEQTTHNNQFNPEVLAAAYYNNFDISLLLNQKDSHDYFDRDTKEVEKEERGFFGRLWSLVWPFSKVEEEEKISTVELDDLPAPTAQRHPAEPATDTGRDLLHEPLFSQARFNQPETELGADGTIYERTIDPLQIEAEPEISTVIEKLLQGDYAEALSKVEEIDEAVQQHPAFRNLILQLRQLIVVETEHEQPDF